MALLLDLVDFIASNGIQCEDGVNAFRDFRPEDPSNVIVLTEYMSDAVDPNLTLANRSVQVQVRDEDPDQARNIALLIHKALSTDNHYVQLNEQRFGLVYLRQVPYKLMQDNKNRTIYAFNFGITTTID